MLGPGLKRFAFLLTFMKSSGRSRAKFLAWARTLRNCHPASCSGPCGTSFAMPQNGGVTKTGRNTQSNNKRQLTKCFCRQQFAVGGFALKTTGELLLAEASLKPRLVTPHCAASWFLFPFLSFLFVFWWWLLGGPRVGGLFTCARLWSIFWSRLLRTQWYNRSQPAPATWNCRAEVTRPSPNCCLQII